MRPQVSLVVALLVVTGTSGLTQQQAAQRHGLPTGPVSSDGQFRVMGLVPGDLELRVIWADSRPSIGSGRHHD